MKFNTIILDANPDKSNDWITNLLSGYVISGKPYLEVLTETYYSDNLIIVSNKDLQKSNKKKDIFTSIKIMKETKGALATAALGIGLSRITEDSPIVICPSDSLIPRSQFIYFIDSMIQNNAECGTVIFKSTDPKYSYIRINNFGKAIEIAEKKIISNFATAGIFFYKSKNIFYEAAKWTFVNNFHTNNKFYLAPSLNYFITKNKNIETTTISHNLYYRFSTMNESNISRKKFEENAKI